MKFRWILLSILRSGGRTGYDVKQIVDTHLGHFWHVTAPQVYAELKSMEKLGWVRKESGPSKRGPARQYYYLTDAGIEALNQSIAQSIEDIEARDEWKGLWWVVSRCENNNQKIHFLRQLIAEHESRLAKLMSESSDISLNSENHMTDDILRDWSISEIQNAINWAGKALQSLGEQKFSSESQSGQSKPAPNPVENNESNYDPFAGLNDSTLL